MPTTYIKRLVINGGPLGLSSAQVIEETVDGGQINQSPARVLETADEVEGLISTGLADTLTQISTITTERDDLINERDSLQAQVATLEANLAAASPVSENEVTMAQARIAIEQGVPGGVAAVDAAIAAISDPQQQSIAAIAWDKSPTISRNSAFVATLGLALGLTDEQIDDLFTAAAAISL